ncbi:MAG: LLM class F420-dependent oxidoreductase [Myxococcota bacterium]|nr:LLM class F420-dependent oxidoreductase [Myxococcota bacterium]
MKIGITFHATDLAIPVHDLAVEAEARGFYSLYVPEHTHIPTSRRTPAPTGDAVLGEEYARSPDPYVSLAAATVRTSQIRLGTGIALPAQHDHIALAKQIATLDRLAQGRFVFGVGYGWNHEEMENHGIEVRTRRSLVREKLLAMQTLWANDVAEFKGERVQLEASWQWPKPQQKPRPITLLGGGAGPTLFSQIAEFADGWMPIGGRGIQKSLPELRRRMEERGRNPDSLQIVPMGVLPNAEKLDYYAEIGTTECVLRLPSATRDEVLPVLDAYTHYL